MQPIEKEKDYQKQTRFRDLNLKKIYVRSTQLRVFQYLTTT